MGVLKVRVGGAWQQLGMAGGPLPPGGVLGDILVKNSATLSDATWGTKMPKLFLENATDVTLSSTDHPLTVGTIASANINIYRGGIQSRQNGAANPLRLNYYGGEILIGGGDPSAAPNGLTISDPIHATSRRVSLRLGTGWQFHQDIDSNGVKDLTIFQAANGRNAVRFSADGQVATFNNTVVTPTLHITAPGTEGIRFTQGGAHIAWWNGGTREGYLQGAANAMYLVAETGLLYLNGIGGVNLSPATINGYTLSTTAGVPNSIVCTDANGYLKANYINTVANVTTGSPQYFAGQTNSDNYIRWYTYAAANQIAWGSTAGQIQSTKVAGGSWADQTISCSPGNTMAGYCLHPGGVAGSFRMAVNDARYHCNNDTGAGYFPIIASAFTLGSSERYKQEIVPLARSLPMLPVNPVATMVRALRPVWYRQGEDQAMSEIPPRPIDLDPDEPWMPPLEDNYIHYCRDEGPGNCGHTPDEPCMRRVNWQRGQLGFVAEEVEQVLPQLVQLDSDMNPQTIDLGSFIGLAYAMLQELDSRITALEPEAA